MLLIKSIFSACLINSALSSLNDSCSLEDAHSCKSEVKEPSPTLAPGNFRFASSYGVDISWPMHYSQVSTNYPLNDRIPEDHEGMKNQPLGNRQEIYNHFMKGCYEKYSFEECDSSERDRVEMSLRQPLSMVNYTEYGFQKIRTPEKLFKLVKDFWETNKDSAREENWGTGNSYVNHWQKRSYMVSVENANLIGGGPDLKDELWFGAEDIVRRWTGQNLRTSSLYGIRIYKEGAILATHVDRLPLVSSVIINVDQDVDEPWPLEVIGHDGRAHNVTMVPGDMVLYESHSILHGRPFAMKGRFMANIFIHFAPVEEGGRPPYVIEGSPDDLYRLARGGYKESAEAVRAISSTRAHDAAVTGNLKTLEKIAGWSKSNLLDRDENGWAPIHEATRANNVKVIEFLLYHGEDVFMRVCTGDTALELAYRFQKKEAIEYLSRIEFETKIRYKYHS